LVLDIQGDYFNSAEILGILGAPTRLKILQLMASGKDFTMSDLARSLDKTRGNISQQIQILEDAGMLRKIKKKDGSMRKTLYMNYDKVIIKL